MRRHFEYHPVFGHRFVPDLKTRIPHEGGGYLVRANAAGFRDHRPFQREKTGSKRVLVFGDSFTAGDGVSNGKRYTDVLERLLPGVEFFNFGLPGTGPDQHYLVYRELAAEMDCDLLLLCPLVENIRRTSARYRHFTGKDGNLLLYAKPYYWLNESGELQLEHVPPPPNPLDESEMSEEDGAHMDRVASYPRLGKLLVKTNLIGLAHKLRGKDPYPEYHEETHPAWQLLRAILKRWIEVHDGPTMLAPLPFYYHVEEMHSAAHYQARFRGLCAETGAVWNDPLPALSAVSQAVRRSYRFEVDTHLTEAGHRALAEALAPGIKSCLLS